MSAVKVKVCGITNVDDACAAVEAGADALGFICYRGSPRYVEPETVKRIVAAVPPFVLAVGVFVNEEAKTVRDITDACGFALVQLHGDETALFCQTLGRPVLRALRVKDRGSLLQLAEYRGRAGVRGFVIDAFSTEAYGGTGRTVDWGLAVEAARAAPVLLAGGLTPGNVAEAVAYVRPYGVDVSSGVEASPGRKDHGKLRDFVRAAKLVPI